MRTAELTGPALDWAVAKCEGEKIGWAMGEFYPIDLTPLPAQPSRPFRPSTDWSQGGPIIERHIFVLADTDGDGGETERWKAEGINRTLCYGPTPLIAAMRCFVASKMGDEIDVPKELQP